jgi:hypothetical protein
VISPLNQIAPRLKKLLLMLSSDRDGEVVNAARLIGSTLRDAGHDWHDLAGALTESPPSKARPRRPPPRDPDPPDGDWRAMREFCLNHMHLVRSREYEFLADLDRWHGELTEKQAAWLHAIYARVRRHAGF